MAKYTSVDILFHFDVDAENTTDARRQANQQLSKGAVGCSICNRENEMTTLEFSIPEETLKGLREKSNTIQELAEATQMCIYDNNSLEKAIAQLVPSARKNSIDKIIETINDPKTETMFREGLIYALECFDIYNY